MIAIIVRRWRIDLHLTHIRATDDLASLAISSYVFSPNKLTLGTGTVNCIPIFLVTCLSQIVRWKAHNLCFKQQHCTKRMTSVIHKSVKRKPVPSLNFTASIISAGIMTVASPKPVYHHAPQHRTPSKSLQLRSHWPYTCFCLIWHLSLKQYDRYAIKDKISLIEQPTNMVARMDSNVFFKLLFMIGLNFTEAWNLHYHAIIQLKYVVVTFSQELWFLR